MYGINDANGVAIAQTSAGDETGLTREPSSRFDLGRLSWWIAGAIIVTVDVVWLTLSYGTPRSTLAWVEFALSVLFVDSIIVCASMLAVGSLFAAVRIWRRHRDRTAQRLFVLKGKRRALWRDLWQCASPWTTCTPPPPLSQNWAGVVTRDHTIDESYIVWINAQRHCGDDLFSISGGGRDSAGRFSLRGYANRCAATGHTLVAWTQTYWHTVMVGATFDDDGNGGRHLTSTYRGVLQTLELDPVLRGTWRLAPGMERPGDVVSGDFVLAAAAAPAQTQ